MKREKMKNIYRKIIAVLAVVITVMSLSLGTVNATSSTDKAELKVTGLTGNPTVKLFKVAAAKYNDTGDSFIDWTFANNVKFADLQKPTSQEINKIANDIRTSTVTPLATYDMSVSGDTASYSAEAGIYIALVTSGDDRTYNPILLTASYNGEGVLSTDPVPTTDTYLYGQTSVAKSSKPTIDKKVTNAVKDDEKNTASIGKVLNYTIDVALPQYPENANNKTIWVGDNMSKGLTFDYSSLIVSWNGKEGKPDSSGNITIDGVIIANVKKETNGFNMVFNYDNLKALDVDPNSKVKISYNGIVNSEAVVGQSGNNNTATYIYANDPTKGTTHNTTDKPSGEGLKEVNDKEIIYTYEVAFKKTGENNSPLAGAVFGIYSDAEATKLIDVVTTNANGYASSSQVGKGTYYIKEITAPKGYTLNTKVYPIETSWATSTTKNSVTSNKTVYTSNLNEAKEKKQVGWLTTDGTFLDLNTPEKERNGAVAAYVKTTTSTTATDSSFSKNTGEGSGTSLLGESIPNTKLSKLPSTGSIGTYIFTLCGFVLMVSAILFSRHKKQKN